MPGARWLVTSTRYPAWVFSATCGGTAMLLSQYSSHPVTVQRWPAARAVPVSRSRSRWRTLHATSGRVAPRTWRRSYRPSSRTPIVTRPCHFPCLSW